MPAPNIRPDAYLSRILDLAIHAQACWTIKRNFLFAPTFPSIIREFYCFLLQLFRRWPFSWVWRWGGGGGRRKLAGRKKEETETKKFIELWIKSGNFLVSAAFVLLFARKSENR